MISVPEDYHLPSTDEELLAECEVQVFRATGPGGQSVNTTDSAVRLIHRPTGIMLVCRRQRSQLRNKHECVKRLRDRIEEAQRPRAPRVPTKPSRRAVQRRLTAKKLTSSKKSARRKPSGEE